MKKLIDEDRLKHSLAVARKMVEIGKKYNFTKEQLYELFVLGYNHDIGYEFDANEKHGIIGGIILKESGYKYWKEIYYHGQITKEFKSIYLDILNMADMQIDKYGNDVGYDNRLEDIKSRYGENSKVYTKVKTLVNNLKRNQENSFEER